MMINGFLVDTDEGTELGLAYRSPLFSRDGISISRSFGLSVPDTPTNNRLFMMSESSEFPGVRTGAQCTINSGGVSLDGVVYLDRWSGGRYELLFMYGDLATDEDAFTRPIKGNVFTGRTLTLTGKDETEPPGQMVPMFGWYPYINGYGQPGIVGNPPTMFPTVNLGWLIEEAAAAIGYTVTMPVAPLRDPHRFGLVLPTMEVYSDTAVRVTGSARSGWTLVSGAATWADVGLTVTARRYKRGAFNANVTVYTFTAIRPVRVEYDPTTAMGNTANVFCAAMGYDWMGGEAFGFGARQFDMDTGDWFTVVNQFDKHNGVFRDYWDGQTGYTTAVDVTFTVKNREGTPNVGDTVSLDDNLPDMSLADLLQAACDLTACVFEVDGQQKTITMYEEEELIDGVTAVDLDSCGVTGVKEIVRYIDGLARRNHVVCKSADYVAEEMRFRRDYPCDNDILPDEQELAVVPFNEGNWRETGGMKLAVFDDVQLAADGGVNYKGTLSVIYESGQPGGGYGLHVQTLSERGVGKDLAAASREAMSVRLTARVPFHKFAGLRGNSMATWRGRPWHVRSAVWQGGLVDFELVLLNG